MKGLARKLSEANEKHGFFAEQAQLDIVLAPADSVAYVDDAGSYSGLIQGVFVTNPKTLFVFDNHSKALFAFLLCKHVFNTALPVVHIDAHKDNAECLFDVPSAITFKNITQTYNQSRIGDFLDVATKGALIGDITRITQSFEFESYTLPQDPYILSLDIDIFGPDGECVSDAIKRLVVTDAWRNAAVVTIATSPGFIDQSYAKTLIEEFYNTLY